MQKFDAYICRLGAIALALISLNANAEPVLVDVRSVDPTITVDLRYAGQTISFDVRFIRAEHTHSLAPKSSQLWRWPRAFCGVTNMASKSGMRTAR